MFELAFQVLVYGLIIGAVYGLATMGLNLIWGVMRVVNFTHAEFLTLGAYTAYWAWVLLGLNPIASIPLSALLGFAVGLLVFYVIIYKLLFSPDIHSTLVATFALGIALAELMKVLWTADYRGVPWALGVIGYSWFSIPTTYVIAFTTCVLIILAMYLILYRTYLGKSIRAVIWDPGAAAICGVNVKRTLAIGFALGSALAFIGGSLIVVYLPTGINPYMGHLYLLKCFVIAVVGGLGNPWGALVGGLVLGLIEQAAPTLLGFIPGVEPLSFTPFIGFLALIIVLLVRPEGILGKR
jgi:branched-chain amino acid transport system permease protein